MIPNGAGCYGPRRRVPRGPGPRGRAMALDVLIIRVPRFTLVHRSYSAQVRPRGRGLRRIEMASQIAVIGAGPCGLAQLDAFEEARRGGAEIPEITCFEQQS